MKTQHGRCTDLGGRHRIWRSGVRRNSAAAMGSSTAVPPKRKHRKTGLEHCTSGKTHRMERSASKHKRTRHPFGLRSQEAKAPTCPRRRSQRCMNLERKDNQIPRDKKKEPEEKYKGKEAGSKRAWCPGAGRVVSGTELYF